MPSFMTALVAKKTEVFSKEYWQKMFADNFGRTEPTEFQLADEAFFKLLELGEHSFITEVILKNPEAFCRPARVATFLTGVSVEKHMDADKRVVSTTRNYPKASPEQAMKVGEAVATILMGRLEVLGRNHQDVDKNFWITDSTKDGYRKETAEVAANLQSTMHGLLNIADGLGDKEGFAELAQFFKKMFGNIPPGVHFRVKNVLYPPPPSAPRREPIMVDGQSRQRSRKSRQSDERKNEEASEEDLQEFRRKQAEEEQASRHTLRDELQEVMTA